MQRNSLLLLILTLIFEGSWCLRDVRLLVAPSAVLRGRTATLLCLYELEGVPLYSVKWYRGTHEFYRYVPNEYPPFKIFPYPGIYVDEKLSNSTQVSLRTVSLNLAGNFSCEVTSEAPLFSTAVVSQQMTVIALPETKPMLYTDRDVYFPGDVLQANCTAAPSKPPAELSFYINGEPVESTSWVQREAEHFESSINSKVILQWSEAWLRVQLQPVHFSSHHGSSNSVDESEALRITCIARISAGGYRESASRQVAARLGEPVHQRVMSESRASTILFHWTFVLITVIILI